MPDCLRTAFASSPTSSVSINIFRAGSSLKPRSTFICQTYSCKAFSESVVGSGEAAAMLLFRRRFLNLLGYFGLYARVFLQVRLGGFPAPADLIAAISKPGASFFNDVVVNCQVQDIPGRANALVVHNVELGFAERRRNLVLD